MTDDALFGKVEVPQAEASAEEVMTSALSRGVARVNRRAARRGSNHRRSMSAPNAALAARAAAARSRDAADGHADDEMTSSASESDEWSDAGFGATTTRDGQPIRRGSDTGRRLSAVSTVTAESGRRHSSTGVHWEATQMLSGATVAEVVRAIVRVCIAQANAGRQGLPVLVRHQACSCMCVCV